MLATAPEGAHGGGSQDEPVGPDPVVGDGDAPAGGAASADAEVGAT